MPNLQVSAGLSTTAQAVTDGSGSSALSLSTNRAGIGTTSPQAVLHIAGSNNVVRLDNVGILNNPHFWITQNAFYDGTWNRIVSGRKCAAINMTAVDGDINFLTDTNSTGTPSLAIRMLVTNAGNVGIGTGSPAQRLHVNGNMQIGSSDFFYLGDSGTEGSWRFRRSGNNLRFERRESGLWNDKGGFNA